LKVLLRVLLLEVSFGNAENKQYICFHSISRFTMAGRPSLKYLGTMTNFPSHGELGWESGDAGKARMISCGRSAVSCILTILTGQAVCSEL
jgi:hypothetical protein